MIGLDSIKLSINVMTRTEVMSEGERHKDMTMGVTHNPGLDSLPLKNITGAISTTWIGSVGE